MEVKNKVAVVTGVSKGIGKATVEKLLENGARVAGWGKTQPDYEHENFRFYPADTGDRQSVEKAFDQTQKDLGDEIHILVNNAGLGYFGYIEELAPEKWHELFNINVHGIFYATRLIVPLMKKQKSGHIINISSIAGTQGIPQGSAYSGSKFAVRGISDCLFRELRDWGIKVSCVFPGSTQTDFFKNAPGIDAHRYMMQPTDVANQLLRLIKTSGNFLINEIVFRPLQPKGPQK